MLRVRHSVRLLLALGVWAWLRPALARGHQKRSLGSRFEAFLLMQNLFNQRMDVSRTPVLTLGSPFFAKGGIRLRLGAPVPCRFDRINTSLRRTNLLK